MYKKALFIFLILMLALTACSAQASAPPEMVKEELYIEAEQPAEAAALDEGGMNSTIAYSDKGALVERMVIKNGNLTIIVADPPESMDRISLMAEEMGGFVVSANLYQVQENSGVESPHGSITIRVPAERMQEAMDRIITETTQPVVSKNISSQDVTSDYVDLQSRLENLQVAEQQLQEIMDQAFKTEDVLAVYNQLVSIREQIEVIKGQMKYLEQSAALSAISVELIADEAVQPVQIGGWQPSGVAKEAIESLVRAMQGLADFGIRLALFILPVLCVIFLPPILVIWGILRWRKKRKAKAKAEVETANEG